MRSFVEMVVARNVRDLMFISSKYESVQFTIINSAFFVVCLPCTSAKCSLVSIHTTKTVVYMVNYLFKKFLIKLIGIK